MKSIQKTKAKYERIFAKKRCNLDNISLCNKEHCSCSLLAEVWAYVDAVVPEDYVKFTIFDFDGTSNSKERQKLLDADIVLNAKNLICEYCWGKTWKYIADTYSTRDSIKEFMRNNSVMLNRLKNGNNIVISGDSDAPSGRTMIASIIMKEAIKLRMKNNMCRTQSYDWIDFAVLRESIKDDSDDLVYYRNCEWLVVDNITISEGSSEKQRAFVSELIDPFFITRYKDNLSTILVFQCDINNSLVNLKKALGTGVTFIVDSKKTYLIPLVKYIEG